MAYNANLDAYDWVNDDAEMAAAAANGLLIFGLSTASTGTTYGIFGLTSSASGFGVYSQGDFGGTGAKYFGPWWVSLRPNYVTKGSGRSRSLQISARRYFGGEPSYYDADDVIQVANEFHRTVIANDADPVQVLFRNVDAAVLDEMAPSLAVAVGLGTRRPGDA